MNVLLLLLFFVIILGERCYYTVNINGVLYRTNRTTNIKLAYFLLIFVASVRYYVGYDYRAYLAIYRANPAIVNIFTDSLRGHDNIGVCSTLIYNIAIYSKTPQLIFIIYSVATLFFIFSTIDKEKDDHYEALIVYLTMFYLESFSTIRQSLAVSIMFWAFKYIKNKNIFKYCISLFLACSFHSSAILSLPIYFIYNYFKLVPTLIGACVLIFAGKPLMGTIMNHDFFSYYSRYVSTGQNLLQGYGKIVFVYRILVLFCLILVLYHQKKQWIEIKKMVVIVLVGTTLPFMFGPHIGMRAAAYFYIYFVLLIPKIYNNIWKNIPSRMIGLIPFYLYYVLFLLIDSLNVSGYTPFQFVFFT